MYDNIGVLNINSLLRQFLSPTTAKKMREYATGTIYAHFVNIL